MDGYKKLTFGEVKGELSEKEKNVFSLLLEGYTVREVGYKLRVSHVRIVKLKQGIVKKCQAKVKR